MTCEEIGQNEVVEQYLLGRLDQAERDAFEQHFFECERCFDRLQTYRALRTELAAAASTLRAEPFRSRNRWISQWAWAPAAAVLVAAASVTFWLRPFPGSVREPARSVGGPPGRAVTHPESGPHRPAPSAPSLAELARFDAPIYATRVLRGAGDPATIRFREAMLAYARKDYRAAIPGLRAASGLDPEAPHATFFLGICYLLTGQVDAGIQALQRTISLGESAYLEEAHFYLAKALMSKNDLPGARRELERTIALGGDRENEARRLRDGLDKLRTLASQP